MKFSELIEIPQPCYDCVDIHGDDPQKWLNQWPKGAEFHSRFNKHLCDGCYDDRIDNENCYTDP